MNKHNTKPNFIILYPDSLGANAVGYCGNRSAHTPNIDRLATTGVDFRNCTSQNPVCMPSRASLLTGKYVSTHGVYDNNVVDYPLGHTTFQQCLKGAGYRTAYFGKTHSINQDDWDEVFDLYPDYNTYLRDHGFDVVYPEKFPLSQLNAGFSKIPAADFSEVVLGNLAVDYIAESATEPSPFLLFMSFEAPHSPWSLPEEYRHFYHPEEIELPEIPEQDKLNKPQERLSYHSKRAAMAETDGQLQHVIAVYHALAAVVDEQIGRIVDAIETAGIRENTVIIFLADHGDHLGNHRTMGKCLSLEEDLIRVPLIITSPDIPNHTCSQLVESIDVFPTLLDLAQLPAPSGLQGRSLVPLLRSPTEPWDRQYSYSEEHYLPFPGLISVRNRTHKLIVNAEGFEELYDLETDPHEWYNRADCDDCRDTLIELKDALINFHFHRLDTTRKAEGNWVTEFMKPGPCRY